jgi:hypothetical protein
LEVDHVAFSHRHAFQNDGASDYLPLMVDDKVHCMMSAKNAEFDYWDGDRRYGYGGYHH